MATARVTAPVISGLGARRFVLPVSVASDWVDVCADPASAESDSGVVQDGVVVAPGLVLRSSQTWFLIAGLGSSVQVRLRYPTAGSVTTSPVVQPFGRDRAGLPQRLLAVGGAHAVPLSADPANDVRDGSYSYTQAVEIDAAGCAEVLFTVRTALAGSGLTGATLQARVL